MRTGQMTRTESMKFQVTELERDLNNIQRKIDKAVAVGQKIEEHFGCREYLRYFNEEYLEQQIKWWFIDNEDETYEIEVRFENNLCYVKISEIYKKRVQVGKVNP